MRQLLVAVCIAVLFLSGGPAQASKSSATAEAIAEIRAFIGAAIRGAYAAHCTDDAVVVDHVPPYVFRGPTACAEHWDATLAYAARNRIEVSNWGSIAEPDFVDASANQVYAVSSARVDWTREGVPEVERGVWTFVVRREDDAWRIAAQSFSTLEIAPSTIPPAVAPVPREQH